MRNVSVGLFGRIGSGKSTLGRLLADRLGCRYVELGYLVRSIARERGLDADDRLVLHEVGRDLLKDMGPTDFARAVLEFAAWTEGSPLVLIGIRHLQVAQALRRLMRPVPLILVEVTVSEAIRLERLAGRDPSDLDPRAGEHETEAQVTTVLPGWAAMTIQNEGCPSARVDEIIGRLMGGMIRCSSKPRRLQA